MEVSASSAADEAKQSRFKKVIAGRVAHLATCPANTLPSRLGYVNQAIRVGSDLQLTRARPLTDEEVMSLSVMLTIRRELSIAWDFLGTAGLEPTFRKF